MKQIKRVIMQALAITLMCAHVKADKILLKDEAMTTANFTLISRSFENNSPMPRVHAHPGYGSGSHNESPPLAWAGAPAKTKSFALILNDPDAVGGNFTHWVIFNIPASVDELPAHAPDEAHLHGKFHGDQGRNDYGTIGYGGPKPPVGTGTHRYTFTLYALDTVLNLKPEATTAPELRKAIAGHVMGQTELIGLFSAPENRKA